MKVRVWKKDPRAKLPEKSTEQSVGYDLFALEEISIEPGEFTLIRTGLVIKAEPPYALFIFPRSSLFKNKGLIMPNSAGIIDFDYCGEEDEIKIPVVNLGKNRVVIKAYEKIAQAIFIKVGNPEIEEISEPPKKSSRGGFGSTGGYL
ncbi:MAG: dUTP diphosphatase [Thermodesulfobacterium geofontis]|uniref:dUTP diphosphatase n=1 Tax=Thermodesulfobacterium geofontis TaxID=1295609 RepID=A0A2N7QCB6_9BACT|nr:MAG: dUTP diphosphatase [Thermodesulfobacterium geofontis]PMP96152.1 MAG: dUTP diphosphatase [Thermodesulfobacterium geofontis]